MSDLYICYIEVLVPALLAVAYGQWAVMRRHKHLYFTMGMLAIVCLMIGQLAYCTTGLSGHTEFREFHIGSLGSVGSCLFFLSANTGPVNDLADGGRLPRKWRLLALLGPAAALLLYGVCGWAMVRQRATVGLVTGLCLTGVTAVSLYYSTLMAIVPDKDWGFIDQMRPYNSAVTLLGLLNTLERGLRGLWMSASLAERLAMFLLYGAMGLCTLAVVILLKRGAARWERT